MHPKRALGVLFLLACGSTAAIPALAYGDRVVPQVPNGIGGDGIGYRTKFDITNLGPLQETRIRNVRVLFFRQDGTPWTVATNLGNVSEIPLDLGPYQTFRIETTGAGSLTSGYVVVRNREPNSYFPEDYNVNVTAFYEVIRGGQVIDTVSVSVSQPTVVWIFPAETDTGRRLLTGFAVVNLSSAANTLQLELFSATTPSSGGAPQVGDTRTVTLAAREQRAVFLNDASLFPAVNIFKGMLRGEASGPVAILALLQTPTPDGVQFATMAPSYVDALRVNNLVYLKQGLPLDADLALTDYTGTAEDKVPWDLLYESSSNTRRQLAPQNGAQVAIIGTRTFQEFDTQITQTFLEGLTYTSNPIDMSDGATTLVLDMAFAVRTELGTFVKLRVADILTTQDNQKHLALEIFPYK
jgi:hypothetical protein